MNPQLKAQLDTVTETARALLELQGALMPTAFIIGAKVQIIGCPWRSVAEKDAAVRVLRDTARKNKAHTFILLSEIWHAPVGEHWDGRPAVDQLGAREAVGVYVETTEDGHWSGLADIVRKNGKATFGPVSYKPMGERDARERFQKILPEGVT